MRASTILSLLRSGKPALIATQCFAIPPLPQHAKSAGFHGIWLENEHQIWNPRELQSYLQIIQLLDLDSMVRIPSREPGQLYQLLDNGATGVLIPHVSTPEEARSCVRALKFPPDGNRGMDSCGLDTSYATAIPGDYAKRSNRERFIAVMIETPEAVANVSEIAAIPGIDVLFIGPGDLCLRLGISFDPSHPAFLEAQAKVAQAAQAHGKFWGRPCVSPADLAATRAAGALLLAYGSDFNFTRQGLQACARDFSEVNRLHA